MNGTVRLSTFDNRWYRRGRSRATQVLWMLASRLFFTTSVPWPSRFKAAWLRLFGAHIGAGVVIKPRVRIKYPWRLNVGDHTWIGEDVWIDSLCDVRLGSDVCLSQGVMIETGNHDWASPTFDLVVREVTVGDGAWAAVRSLLLPGARLAPQAVLGAGSALSGDTEPYGIYVGVPARKLKQRVIREEEE